MHGRPTSGTRDDSRTGAAPVLFFGNIWGKTEARVFGRGGGSRASDQAMSVSPLVLEMSAPELLECAGHDLRGLLSETARPRLHRGASTLALPARTLCLECRLDDSDRVDLALCLAPHTAGLTAALEKLSSAHIGNRAWSRCMDLLLLWARGEHTVLSSVPVLFTAFDLDGIDTPEMPVPCLSLCTDPSFVMRRLGMPAPRASSAFPLRLLDVCSGSLELDWITQSLRSRFQRCLDAAEAIEPRQLSLMLSRRPPALKLDLTLPVGELPRFLAATSWQGNTAALMVELQQVAPWQQRVQLNYVVTATQEPQPLEVELCCTGPDEPDEAGRAALLERLVARGLASQIKAQALLELSRRPTTFDTDGRWCARNWYVKLRFLGGRFESAKAYVGLMTRSIRTVDDAGCDARPFEAS